MKLILSSTDFLNEKSKNKILNNLGISLENCKVLFIPNEKSTKEKINSGKYHKRLIDTGFSKNNIYIFDESRVEEFIDLDINLIYVGGGNTFSTLNKIRKCGFDKYIIKYINNGVIYLGGSAGAHIVTKNIKHVLSFEKNYVKIKNYNALSLFDGILFCHYDDNRKEQYLEAKRINKYKVYKITNEEIMVVENENIKII